MILLWQPWQLMLNPKNDGDYDINVVNTRRFPWASQIPYQHYSAQSEMITKYFDAFYIRRYIYSTACSRADVSSEIILCSADRLCIPRKVSVLKQYLVSARMLTTASLRPFYFTECIHGGMPNGYMATNIERNNIAFTNDVEI